MNRLTKILRRGGIGGKPHLRKFTARIVISLTLVTFTLPFIQSAQADMETTNMQPTVRTK